MIEDTVQYKYWQEHKMRIDTEIMMGIGGMTGTRPSKEVWEYPEKWHKYNWYWYVNIYEQIEKDVAKCNKTPEYMPAKEFDRSLQNQALLYGFDNWGEVVDDELKKWKKEMDNRDKTFPGGWPPRLQFKFNNDGDKNE